MTREAANPAKDLKLAAAPVPSARPAVAEPAAVATFQTGALAFGSSGTVSEP
ncbi:hypothetical protein D3C72_1307470 [compost metagenome]